MILSLLKREVYFFSRHYFLSNVNLEITYVCNLRCVICAHGKAKGALRNELGLSEWRRLLKELICMGVKKVAFIGAEPLIRYSDVIEMAAYLNNSGIVRQLTTNATLINQEMAEKLFDVFENISISVDAPDERHDRIRGQKGAFDAVQRGLQLLLDVKRKRKAQTRIAVHTTIFNSNYNVFEDMISFAEKIGVDLLNFQYITQVPSECRSSSRLSNKIIASDCYTRQAGASFLLDEKQVGVLRQQLKRLKHRRGKVKVVLKPLELFSDVTFLSGEFPVRRCYITKNRAIISPTGNVGVCSHFNYSLGNVRDEPMNLIWGNKKHKIFLQALAKNLFPVCLNCCHFSANLTPWQQIRLVCGCRL